MACNLCCEEYHKKLLKGKTDKIKLKKKSENCPTCKAPSRFKTFRLAFDRLIVPKLKKPKEQLSALAIAATKIEQDIIRSKFGSLVSASLYGSYNNYGNVTIQTDLRNLKEFPDQRFDLVQACGVVDFIYELDDVLASVYRVLKPGGFFLFLILDYRLVNNNDPPKIIGTKKEPYFPEGIELPSVMFGKKYLLRRMEKVGFKAEKYEITDYFSGTVCNWFLGRK